MAMNKASSKKAQPRARINLTFEQAIQKIAKAANVKTRAQGSKKR